MRRWDPAFLSESDLAGQLFFVGVDGTALDPELSRKLRTVAPGGVILFARNLQDALQVAIFCRELLSSLPLPPFLAIDQEGGRVNRLKGIVPAIPPNLVLARGRGARSLVRDHGRETGRALALLGFNLNFAPVLDLSDADIPNGIGDRAYGDDPAEVADLARLFLEAQGASGVLGCGKHVPGLGGARVDSHQDLPRIDLSAEELWDRDLAPYRLLREKLPLVMVGHAHYPAVQGPAPGPATLSREIVAGLLRGRIGYPGIILTDDLEMGAVDQRRPPGDLVLEALTAGNDMVMICKSWDRIEQAHAAVVRALRTGALSRPRIEDSLSRILSLKKALPLTARAPDFDPVLFEEACGALGSLGNRLRS